MTRKNRDKLSKLNPQKPYLLRRWRVETETGPNYFFTCARPGRSSRESSKTALVSDESVHRWVLGLCGSDIAIVSLLGRKNGPEGKSEFSFYSFCGGLDKPSEREGRPTFQEWLNLHHQNPNILVIEHPTYDGKTISLETLDAIKADIERLIKNGCKVVVVDSGGLQRTGKVGRYMGAKEDFSIKI